MYFTVTLVMRNNREVSGRKEATSADLLAQTIDNERREALRSPTSASTFKMTDAYGVVTGVDLTRVDFFRVSPS